MEHDERDCHAQDDEEDGPVAYAAHVNIGTEVSRNSLRTPVLPLKPRLPHLEVRSGEEAFRLQRLGLAGRRARERLRFEVILGGLVLGARRELVHRDGRRQGERCGSCRHERK